MVYLVLTSINGAVGFAIAIFNFERTKQHVHTLYISMPSYRNFSARKVKAVEQLDGSLPANLVNHRRVPNAVTLKSTFC